MCSDGVHLLGSGFYQSMKEQNGKYGKEGIYVDTYEATHSIQYRSFPYTTLGHYSENPSNNINFLNSAPGVVYRKLW